MSQRAAAASAPISRVEELVAARPAQLAWALLSAMVAGVSTAFAAVAFDWRLEIADALLGTAAFGALHYWNHRGWVPRGRLSAAPPQIEPEYWDRRSFLLRLPLVIAVSFLLAWLGDLFDAGAAFVPGYWTGSTLGALALVARIRRWEVTHGRRVLVDPDANRPYAGQPL